MTGEQVVLLGLDGLGWGEIREWVEDGTLSTLQSLRDAGTGTTLRSTHPPWTPCAWPSLLSGRNPGHHGVFDFFTADGYEKRLIDRGDVDAPYVHEVADAHGLVPLAVNYPVTHPATELENGAVVPGYVAPEDAAFHPPELRDAYESEYGPYRLYPDYKADENAVAEYVSVARSRRDVTRLLDERYDWDLLAVQFQVTDSVFHALDDREEIRRVLAKVDEFAGDIVDLAADDAHVFVVSDHGMGDYSWTFYVNSWLADNGYCETTTGETQYFPQMKSKLKAGENGGKADGRGKTGGEGDGRGKTGGDRSGRAKTGGEGNGGDGNGGEENAREKTGRGGDAKPHWSTRAVTATTAALSTVGLSPRRIHRGLATVGLAETVESLLPKEALLEAQNRTVDHANSTAYQLLFNSFGVHLNVQGRETDGRIPPNRYDAVRDRLMAELASVRDPDGEPVFETVQPREAVYEGPNVQRAPDVVVTPRDYQYDVSGTLVDTFRRNRHKNHKPEGILVTNRDLKIAGDVDTSEADASAGASTSDASAGASIYDVAPTVAAALGLPADSKTDGRVLPPFSVSSDAEDWGDVARTYVTDERSAANGDVEGRLADLGYLE